MSRTVDFSYIIGASVSEPLSSDVYVDFVCHGPSSGIAKAHASHFFAHGPYGMATAHASHFFLQVAVYVTMDTVFRQYSSQRYLESSK